MTEQVRGHASKFSAEHTRQLIYTIAGRFLERFLADSCKLELSRIVQGIVEYTSLILNII